MDRVWIGKDRVWVGYGLGYGQGRIGYGLGYGQGMVRER